MVRQPVFVRVDANEILEGTSHANFFVGLELGNIDEHVSVHRRAAEHVLVTLAGVALVRLAHVERSAKQPAVTVKSYELTRVVQPDECVSRRVAGELFF